MTILDPAALFTVTSDDEYIFRVQMYANQGKEISIPTVACSEAKYISDFKTKVQEKIKTSWSLLT